jgi:toxin HigB-1
MGVINSFRHKGLQQFFGTGSKAGIQSEHAAKLSRQLAVLNRGSGPPDMNLPGWALHPLEGRLSEHWSLSVSGNWRLTFKFETGGSVRIFPSSD